MFGRWLKWLAWLPAWAALGQDGAWVTRDLPERYFAGDTVEVKLSVNPPASAANWRVVERFPSNWDVVSAPDATRTNELTGELEFGPYDDGTPRVITYTVQSVFELGNTARFAGTAEADGAETPTGGDTEVAGVREWEFAGPQTLPGGGYYVSGTAYGAGRWVASSWGWTTTSEDGRHWTYPKARRSYDNHWSRIAFLGGRFIQWGTAAGRPLISMSEDGLTWRDARLYETTVEPGMVTSVAFGNGRYVAVGRHLGPGEPYLQGAIWTSTNGYDWEKTYRVKIDSADIRPADPQFPISILLNAIAYGDGQFMAVGELGLTVVSPDGLHWTERQPIAAPGDTNDPTLSLSLTGVCHGDQGWIVTATKGGPSYVLRSTDGVVWSTVTQPPGFNGHGLFNSFFSDGKYWFSDSGTQGYWTETGTDWHRVGAGTTSVSAISRAPDGVSPRYVGGGASGAIFASEDGLAWHQISPPSAIWPNLLTAIGWDSEWVISGQDISVPEWLPPIHSEGIPWLNAVAIHRADPELNWSSRFEVAMADYAPAGKDVLVASAAGGFFDRQRKVRVGPVAEGEVISPASFRLMNQQSVRTNLLQRFLSAIQAGASREWIHASLAPVPGGTDLYLETGIHQDFNVPFLVQWGHFFSSNGVDWLRRDAGLNDATNYPGIRSLAYGSGRFVAVGTGSSRGVPTKPDRIYTSLDGEQYAPLSETAFDLPLGGEGLTGIVFGKGLFVAVGDRGRILTSANGTNWGTPHASDGIGWNRIRFLNNEFIAVGNQGRLFFSRDGVNWRQRPTGVMNDLNDIAFRHGEYLAVGNHAMVLHAQARESIPFVTEEAGTDRLAYGAGDEVTLSISASGTDPLTYRWFRLDETGQPMELPGATSASHSFIASGADDGARFQVVIENEFGRITNGPVMLRVVEGVAPRSYALMNGDSDLDQHDSLYAGTGERELDNAPLAGGLGELFDGETGLWPAVEGGTSEDHRRWVAWQKVVAPELTFDFGRVVTLSELRLHTVNLGTSGGVPGAVAVAFSEDGVEFGPEQHRVTDFASFAPGTHQYLTVPVAGRGRLVRVKLERRTGAGLIAASEFRFEAMQPPEIVQPPVSISVLSGQTAQLTVGVTGSAPFVHSWFKDGEPLTAPDSPVLDLGIVTLDSAGTYRIEVSNLAGVATSDPVLVTVFVPPAFTAVPLSATIRAGQTVGFGATVTGFPTPTLRWQWSPDGSAWTDLTDAGGVSGAATAVLTLANVPENWSGRRYRLSATNPADTAFSPPVTLTVLPPLVAPTITVPPVNATVAAGQDAFFAVTASGTTPLEHQWFFTPPGGAEQAVEGATAATLVLAAVTPEMAGSYRVRVANEANPAGVFSQAATLTVTGETAGFVNRRLPGVFVPGRMFEVVLEAKPAAAVAFYALSDRPPAGWTVSGVNEGGSFDSRTGEVKFGPFGDNAPRTLRYTVLPPDGANGRFEFIGLASSDGVESAIGGTGVIENSVTHPADVNTDQRLAINEATGYGAAWKRGESWTLPPNPVPVNYVTRAGFLWRNGELYRLNPAAGGAPLWWVPETPATPNVVRQTAGSASTATRSFSDTAVTVEVVPATQVSVYAVEERLFAGFTATGISHGGVFLPEQGLIRWGPFFDHQARELTYTVGAPANFEGEIAILGLVSEDGDSFPVAGDSVLRFGTAELPPPVTPEVNGDSFKLDVAGPLNARVIIETTDALGGAWTVATEFELNKPGQSWSVPVEVQESGKFFRVRVIVP